MLKYPFASYAASFWVNHLKKHEDQLPDRRMSEVAWFLTHKKLFLSWIQVLEYVEVQKTTEDGYRGVEEPTLSTMLNKNMWPLDAAKALGLGERVVDAISSSGYYCV